MTAARCGLTLTLSCPEVTVIVADEDLVPSVAEVAVSVTVEAGTLAGAV